jgi:uncharacterized protein (DUF983 family)
MSRTVSSASALDKPAVDGLATPGAIRCRPMATDPTTPGAVQETSRTQPVWRLWWRAGRLRCPACGRAPIFRGWFAMHELCASCGRQFNRDPGYFLGAIYFNYGITAVLVLTLYFTMYFRDWLTDAERLVALSLFGVLFPIWFFRYSRALWIAFDERWDPWPNTEEARTMEEAARRSGIR